MTKCKDIRWEDGFPLREEAEDFSGRKRTFVISCHEGPLGYTVHASEEGKEGLGYEFRAYSETSPYSALGRVREKMRRGLAMRHIKGSPGNYDMLHSQLHGRISSDGEGGVILIVDGLPLTTLNLAGILATHEGFDFTLNIEDSH